MKKKLLLIDGHGLAFRGFYALPETLAASDGTPTNAIVGFTNMLIKCIDEFKPDALGLFFDPKGPTRRHEMFKAYKEGRKPTPEGFKVQIPMIIDISKLMGVPVFIRDGMEADDYIVSTAKNSALLDFDVTILSADKDLFQVIDENVSVMRPTKGVSEFKIYDASAFEEEYGFKPPLMADYLALLGDNIDNIPGVPGIGEKTAKELISKYGALEAIYEHTEEIPKGRRAKLEDGREQAFISRSLVVPQETEHVPSEQLVMSPPDAEALSSMCRKLGLKKILKRFELDGKSGEKKQPLAKKSEIAHDERGDFSSLLSIKTVGTSFEELLSSEVLAIACGETEENIFWISDENGKTASFCTDNTLEYELFKKWCEKGTLLLYGYRVLLVKSNLPMPEEARIIDIENAHYLLHPDRGGASASKTFGFDLPRGMALAPMLFGIWNIFKPQLEKNGLCSLMYELDMPLAKVLSELERTGFAADVRALRSLEGELEKNITFLEEALADMAGEKINLNSPKQVAWLLFERLNLPPIKKTATGFSTDISVLEELAAMPEPLCDVPKKLMEHREESKILNGFVQPFLKLSSSGDGRIHSTFDHLATGTGRLASRDPNVQNMPVFGEWASKFRNCFVPADGNIFVSADYSQIELRVLAHLSGEERLINAFTEGRDVHMETASWVFGLPPEDITAEQRRFAKVVNFGLIYGMSAHGLAQRLGISRPQAVGMVERYFSVLPRVKEYITGSVSEAKSKGYTVSLFGRRRSLSEVSTIEGRGHNSIDRVAVNTPIQSTASDIAKIALIRFSKALKDEFTGADVILQIHDSIVCECRESEADIVEKRLVEVMQGVDVLSVPVKAEAKRGYSLGSV